MDKQILDEYTNLFLKEYAQTYNGLFLHPEAGRDSKINESLDNIKADLKNIDDILITTGQSVNDLLTNTVNRLAEVKKCIISEKERYQDIQMLCNKYTDFDNVKTMDDVTFTGNGAIENGVYQASTRAIKKDELTVTSILGNGYEGNKFVYNNYEYQNTIYDTSIRENMTDSKISTYYEYSRITVQNVQTENISYFNKDSENARCTMTFRASDVINYIDISTEDLGINVTAIQYSTDGIKYIDLNLPEKLVLNDKLEGYNNYGYVYGSGLIAIPPCIYFKITLESTKNKNDIIAYEKTLFENEKEIIQDNAAPITNTATVVVDSAKRCAIKINDISAYYKQYVPSTTIQSSELISAPCYSIGFFANVYIPDGFGLRNDNAVQFFMTINGKRYEMVPMNSHSNGTKVIRFSGGKSNTSYTKLINEKITSAVLTIVMNGQSYVTPYVSNIKILMGGEI